MTGLRGVLAGRAGASAARGACGVGGSSGPFVTGLRAVLAG
jgi:hypothetical protein